MGNQDIFPDLSRKVFFTLELKTRPISLSRAKKKNCSVMASSKARKKTCYTKPPLEHNRRRPGPHLERKRRNVMVSASSRAKKKTCFTQPPLDQKQTTDCFTRASSTANSYIVEALAEQVSLLCSRRCCSSPCVAALEYSLANPF